MLQQKAGVVQARDEEGLKRMTVTDKASKIYQEAEKQTQYVHLQQICSQYVLHTKISQ